MRELLEQSYEIALGDECPPRSRHDFLGEHIFDFTTYDGDMSELFARKALEVCVAITDGQTFDYITDADNYRWFLLMVNMPFFVGRLEWGTSIRGAWWVHEDQNLESCGLWCDGEQVLSLKFSRTEWVAFVAALAQFASDER
jgi:hypothetical protein